MSQSGKQKGLDPLRKDNSCSRVPSLQQITTVCYKVAQGGIKEHFQARILRLGPIIKERESGGMRSSGSLEKVLPKALPQQYRGVGGENGCRWWEGSRRLLTLDGNCLSFNALIKFIILFFPPVVDMYFLFCVNL